MVGGLLPDPKILSTNIGVVDYIGGSKLFDNIKNNDMVFVDVSYSF